MGVKLTWNQRLWHLRAAAKGRTPDVAISVQGKLVGRVPDVQPHDLLVAIVSYRGVDGEPRTSVGYHLRRDEYGTTLTVPVPPTEAGWTLLQDGPNP